MTNADLIVCGRKLAAESNFPFPFWWTSDYAALIAYAKSLEIGRDNLRAIIDKLADVRRQCFPGKPCEMKGGLLEMRDEIFRLRLKTTTGLEGALKQAEAQLAEARKLLEQVNSLQCREGLDPTPYCDIYDYDFLHPPAKSTDNPHPGPAMEAEPL